MSESRRVFLGSVAAGFAASAAQSGDKRNGIPYRNLGRTGEKVSAVGIGGFHIGNPRDEQETIRLTRSAIDQGINFMDNCWDYHDGESERRMGKALRDGYRKRVFLMSKIDGQTRDAASKQIDESLERLQTEMVDLMQFHEMIRPNDPDRVFAKGGSFEAMLAAQKAGKIRYIGFTGHKDPEIHLKMIQTGLDHGFTFDTVQMPLNLFDAHYDSFTQKVVPVALKHRIGILGMKPMGGGVLLKTGTAAPTEFLRYAMSLPTSVVITGCENQQDLDQAVQTARNFKPLDQKETAALLEKTRQAAQNGAQEKYKTARMFDGTFSHPEWLGLPKKPEDPAGA
jgi:predicted aldo/keto reductase-like oxidoreductase